MAVAGHLKKLITSTEHPRLCLIWIMLKATKAGRRRAETGRGGLFYHACAVAEQDPAIWTSWARAQLVAVAQVATNRARGDLYGLLVRRARFMADGYLRLSS
jgi:hypothetical protein